MPKRFLVTAGNTREPIDRVRDWGNIFTGNTGFAIANALADLGSVDLLTSNQAHLDSLEPDEAIRGEHFRSHADLVAALDRKMRSEKYDAIFMTAAVADYSPAGAYEVVEKKTREDGSEEWIVRNVQKGKVSSAFREVAFLGKPTEKIVDLFRGRWGFKGLLVKFKLEVGISKEELVAIGQKSRRASSADFLVANTLEMVTGEGAGAFLLGENLQEWVPRGTLAARLKALVKD